MKIGIITHHYVGNFGAVLQTFALMNTLRELFPEAEVTIIDYRVKQHDLKSNSRFFHYKIGKDTFRSFYEKLKLYRIFRDFQRSMQHTKKICNAIEIVEEGFDYIVIGSDEVWNFNDKQSYSTIKYGVGISDKIPTISYAASAGGSSRIDELPEPCREGLKNFKGISVRDVLTQNIVTTGLGIKCKMVLDPTLLYDFTGVVRNKIQKILSKKYILVYDCRLSEAQLSGIREYAHKKNMILVGAGEYDRAFDCYSTAITPFEWTQLFRNANYIITGTFHGTAFSIKYERQFVTYLTEENRIQKVSSLLAGTGLENRIILKDTKEQLLNVLDTPVDYSVCNRLLDKQRRISIDFIKDNIT